MIPGEIVTADGDLELNAGRRDLAVPLPRPTRRCARPDLARGCRYPPAPCASNRARAR